MPTVSKVNDILCVNISKIDNITKANAKKLDNIDFCSPTPTPTPTQSPGGSPTPTPTITPTPTVTPTITPTITPDPSKTPTQTPTPTITPTPTPTPSLCQRDVCCFVELCFGNDCTEACSCNDPRSRYLHIPCGNWACRLENADGIFDDDGCTTPSQTGYYADAGGDCYYWDGTNLSNQGPC